MSLPKPGKQSSAMIVANDDAGPAPLAWVAGKSVTTLPQGLYVPPDALKVFLAAFEGPLDLLLYLIRKQNLDILDIQVAAITEQYVQYIELMHAMQLDLVGEYLVMAALLAQIKSHKLLPQAQTPEEQEEDDVRAQLVLRLQTYQRIRQAAELIKALPRFGQHIFDCTPQQPKLPPQEPPPVKLNDLVQAFERVLSRSETRRRQYTIMQSPLSTSQRMADVLQALRNTSGEVMFADLCPPQEGRSGLVVTFMALLELIRSGLIEALQKQPAGPIQLRLK